MDQFGRGNLPLRLMGGLFFINGQTDDWNFTVGRILLNIASTKTGYAIIHKISVESRMVTIEANYAHPLDLNAGTDTGSYINEWFFKQPTISFNLLNDAKVVEVNGDKIERAEIRANYPGEDDDERLFHELIHAARIVGGDKSNTELPRGRPSSYGNMEEFVAVTVANIYLSEKGKTLLRSGHSATARLYNNNPDDFLTENLQAIDEFCERHPVMAPMIARAPAAFNPIRSYYAKKTVVGRMLAKQFT